MPATAAFTIFHRPKFPAGHYKDSPRYKQHGLVASNPCIPFHPQP